MMVAMAGMTFVSCGDDDDTADTNESNYSLIGTWKYDFSDPKENYIGYVLYTFDANGTGREFEYDDGEIDSDETFIYTYRDGILKITYLEDKYSDEYVIVWIDKNTIKVLGMDDGNGYVIMMRVK